MTDRCKHCRKEIISDQIFLVFDGGDIICEDCLDDYLKSWADKPDMEIFDGDNQG